jgi:hypothetical protein
MTSSAYHRQVSYLLLPALCQVRCINTPTTNTLGHLEQQPLHRYIKLSLPRSS